MFDSVLIRFQTVFWLIKFCFEAVLSSLLFVFVVCCYFFVFLTKLCGRFERNMSDFVRVVVSYMRMDIYINLIVLISCPVSFNGTNLYPRSRMQIFAGSKSHSLDLDLDLLHYFSTPKHS